MRKGLNLFKSEIGIWKEENYNFLPPRYLEFAKYFKLGEKELNIDFYIHQESGFKIPLTNIVFHKEEIELFVEQIFNPEQIKSILIAGEEQEDTFTKFNLVRLGILTSPHNSQLYLGIANKADKIFFHMDGMHKDQFVEIESNIFDFAMKLKLVENSHQINESNYKKFIKMWGNLEWTKAEHEL